MLAPLHQHTASRNYDSTQGRLSFSLHCQALSCFKLKGPLRPRRCQSVESSRFNAEVKVTHNPKPSISGEWPRQLVEPLVLPALLDTVAPAKCEKDRCQQGLTGASVVARMPNIYDMNQRNAVRLKEHARNFPSLLLAFSIVHQIGKNPDVQQKVDIVG